MGFSETLRKILEAQHSGVTTGRLGHSAGLDRFQNATSAPVIIPNLQKTVIRRRILAYFII